MKRVKLGQGYHQSGYGRGFKKSAIVWLIDGKAYAKDSHSWETDFNQLQGDLKGYVRVNALKPLREGEPESFFQVSGSDHEIGAHRDYSPIEDEAPKTNVKEKLDLYAKTALDLKLFTIASRLCTALETAHRVDMNTPEDFGGEWASIECDIESVDEEIERGNLEDLDAREVFEGEQIAKQADGRLY